MNDEPLSPEEIIEELTHILTMLFAAQPHLTADEWDAIKESLRACEIEIPTAHFHLVA
jgi:hypothetical protein